MISKTKIGKRIRNKTNPDIAETMLLGKKQNNWVEVIGVVSGPTRKHPRVNLSEIDKNSKEGDTIVVPGKVLGGGEVSKKIRICALSYSESAIEKLKEKKCEIKMILEEIKENPQARGIKMIK